MRARIPREWVESVLNELILACEFLLRIIGMAIVFVVILLLCVGVAWLIKLFFPYPVFG